MLYSKNGSIPNKRMDGAPGWIEVEDPPVAPEGMEVVWWYPPGWVVRNIRPNNTETTMWKWSQELVQWVEYPIPIIEEPIIEEMPFVEPATGPVMEQPTVEEPTPSESPSSGDGGL